MTSSSVPLKDTVLFNRRIHQSGNGTRALACRGGQMPMEESQTVYETFHILKIERNTSLACRDVHGLLKSDGY